MTPAALQALVTGDKSNFIAAMIPGGIEAQEKAGQIEQSFAETLPIDGTDKDRRMWEALGFVFGNPVEGIFVQAKFPEGWHKRPTDHSMWSDIVDGKGRKRGSIFYKAAFYDLSAHCGLKHRFGISVDYEVEPKAAFISDECGKVKQRIEGLHSPDWRGDRNEAEKRQRKMDEAKEKLSAWLSKEFPEWKSPTAYWE